MSAGPGESCIFITARMHCRVTAQITRIQSAPNRHPGGSPRWAHGGGAAQEAVAVRISLLKNVG